MDRAIRSHTSGSCPWHAGVRCLASRTSPETRGGTGSTPGLRPAGNNREALTAGALHLLKTATAHLRCAIRHISLNRARIGRRRSSRVVDVGVWGLIFVRRAPGLDEQRHEDFVFVRISSQPIGAPTTTILRKAEAFVEADGALIRGKD
jgi:hypothetical protein